MDIDVNALQMLPEVETTPTGLKPKCKPRTNVCINPSCKETLVVVSATD